MKKTLKNWFYKDSRLTITKNPTMPDGGYGHSSVDVNMLTINPYEEKSVTLKDNQSITMNGSYGLSPFEIFNPFKTNSNIAWLMMYQKGLLKDVSAEINKSGHDPILVTVNNPQVGYPYAIIYDNPIAAVLPYGVGGTRFNLDEGESAIWTSAKGLSLTITRVNDTDCKEFKIRVK
jgi:hypothetical protein